MQCHFSMFHTSYGMCVFACLRMNEIVCAINFHCHFSVLFVQHLNHFFLSFHSVYCINLNIQKLQIKTVNRPPLKCMHRARTMIQSPAKHCQVYRKKVIRIRMKEVNPIIW